MLGGTGISTDQVLLMEYRQCLFLLRQFAMRRLGNAGQEPESGDRPGADRVFQRHRVAALCQGGQQQDCGQDRGWPGHWKPAGYLPV